TTGNDNITIAHNHIRNRSDIDLSSYNGIYAIGTASAINDSIKIENNEIFNIWSASAGTNGVYIRNYNRNVVIHGNSIYQTVPRSATGLGTLSYAGIDITSNDGNYVVTNNYIGGSAAMTGGDPWTQTGTANATFIGI